jgi:hypothetical protein
MMIVCQYKAAIAEKQATPAANQVFDTLDELINGRSQELPGDSRAPVAPLGLIKSHIRILI